MTEPLFNEQSLTWITAPQPLVPQIANDVYHVQSKAVLVDLLHCAVGYPLKKHRLSLLRMDIMQHDCNLQQNLYPNTYLTPLKRLQWVICTDNTRKSSPHEPLQLTWNSQDKGK